MWITRRRFVAGSAILAGAAFLGRRAAVAEPPLQLIATSTNILRAHMAEDRPGHDTRVSSSVWHLDRVSYDHAIIRHQSSNLAYLIDDSCTLATVVQIHPRCWQESDPADPDDIGLAARHIVDEARYFSPVRWKRALRKPLFLSYRGNCRKPGAFAYVAKAPPIKLTALSESEAEAFMEAAEKAAATERSARGADGL